jgi:lipoyl-dependent peroxiredoxin
MKRKATSVWKGNGKEGNGHLTTDSGVLQKTPYAFNTRFEQVKGTNPEELIAAAHAGCFGMKLSFVLGEAGFTPDELTTECAINFENGVLTDSLLKLTAKVPGISKEKFQECAEKAKATCPVSNALKIQIALEATLA